ncbi:TonB-dependent receptor [Sphingomonas canadensis]|uniref:TonB-dependent receptor n=1 Tax=Sphingomonas canadensis TaxID=1219257 RepID=A0ABW3HAS1_9SPHN|nr:TonB-dependent receptor [Sphingomonas canadensis]MCW3838286.1 TonB-dependent receptor [Sphingomonas canadensis]
MKAPIESGRAPRFGAQRIWAASLAAIAISAAAPALASAPEPDQADEQQDTGPANGEIVVTAQFRDQNLQDTPLAITAMTGDQLEARGQNSVADIAGQAPNVSLEKGEGQRGSGLIAYIRGIGQYNSAPFYEPGVGTYVDDVYIASMTGALFKLLDLDRVEVLRGPQGTLAGKNSVGGAIKLFSLKPKGDGSGYAEVTYGSFDRIEGRAAGDFALTDNMFVRINVAAKKEDGYVTRLDYGCLNPASGFPQLVGPGDGCKAGTAGGESYVAGRAALRWLPAENIEINISGDYTAERNDPGADMLAAITNQANVPPTAVAGIAIDSRFATGGTYTSYADFCNRLAYGGTGAYCFDPTNKADIWGIQGSVDVDLSDHFSVKAITSYRSFATYAPNDSDGTPIPLSNLQVGYHGNQFSQELRLNGEVADNLLFTLGGYYLRSFVNGDQRVDIQYINFLFFNDDDTTSKSKAGYAQVVWDPIPQLHLTGGLRYTKETKDYVFYRTEPNGASTPIPGLYGLQGIYRGNSWDYRGNISFDVNDDVMIYAQYATGFKGGGTNGQPFFPDQVYPFGPERIGTWEGGVKMSLLDRRLTLNSAVFYSDYTDIQLQALTCPPPSTPAPCAGPQNVGSAHIKGFEIELAAEPVDGLNIDATLAHLDFDYYAINNVPTMTLDMRAPFTPEWKASFGAQYKIPLGGGAGSITPRIDVTYQSDLYTDPVNTAFNRIAGRTLANARLTWDNPDRNWQLALEVTNLTDKYYYSNYIDNTTFTGSTYGYPGAPRRWALSVKRTF